MSDPGRLPATVQHSYASSGHSQVLILMDGSVWEVSHSRVRRLLVETLHPPEPLERGAVPTPVFPEVTPNV